MKFTLTMMSYFLISIVGAMGCGEINDSLMTISELTIGEEFAIQNSMGSVAKKSKGTNADSSTTELTTSAPPLISLAPSTSTSYTIQGGSPPYLVRSVNTKVATANVFGSNVFVTGIGAGVGSIVILDSDGVRVHLQVHVSS